MSDGLNPSVIQKAVALALEEDLGSGDVTTDTVVPPEQAAYASLWAKERLTLAGLPVLREVFRQVDERVVLITDRKDGDVVSQDEEIARINGPVRGILKGERVGINFLQHLSGIATLTSRYVKQVEPYKAQIIDTRKTIPGLRALEKYAVTRGGGRNHRFGLYDGILIKDNHIDVAGGIEAAVKAARSHNHHLLMVEVEIERIEQVDEALKAGADVIMLDNMNREEMTEAVKTIGGRALVEASGTMNLKRALAAAQTGVDLISVGALTHSVKAMDISLRFSSV